MADHYAYDTVISGSKIKSLKAIHNKVVSRVVHQELLSVVQR